MKMQQKSTNVEQTVKLFTPDLTKLFENINRINIGISMKTISDSIAGMHTPQFQEISVLIKQINFKIPYSIELSNSLSMVLDKGNVFNSVLPKTKIENSLNFTAISEQQNYESNYHSVGMGPRTVRVRQNDIIEFIK